VNTKSRNQKQIIEILIIIFLTGVAGIGCQTFAPNYDESKVPSYILPDPLILENGGKVENKDVWENVRRKEIIKLFEKYVYGRAPSKPGNISFRINSVDSSAFGGKAVRKEIVINISGNNKTAELDLLIYLPNNGKPVHPVFLGLNFYGNQSITVDPGVTISKSWMMENEEYGIVNHRATEKTRGVRCYRWPIEYILERGYGLATMYYGDIDPDYDDGYQNGLQPLFYKSGQTEPEPDEWGSIAEWAWGLSRAMDYLETDNEIDNKQVIVMGHSRLGKTSLWAGALDERFAVVISNESGCGGSALFRRRFGETIAHINRFHHWFNGNFKNFNNRDGEIPVDQHMLIALIAPRPVYIASAIEDSWADPRGEFLSAKYAGRVYKLYSLKGLETEDMPEINMPIMNTIGYHIRSGGHDITKFDWEKFIDFADLFMKK
jgi:hypothetical protein